MKRKRNNSQRILAQCSMFDRQLERKEVRSKESSHNSLSVDPGPVAFGCWKESDAGLRRCSENQHAVRGACLSTRREGVFFDAAGEFRDHYNGEVLDWSLEITGTNNETTRIGKTGVPMRRHKSKKPSTERVIHTDVFNRSKRNQVRSRVVTRDTTAGVSAPEHYVSARACRMMLKGRTQQLVSYDVSAVSFRAWIGRDARVKLPKDFRLASECDESIPAPESRCKPAERHPETNPPMVD